MESDLDLLLGTCNESRLFTGSVLVAKGGEVVYKKSFGTVKFDSDEKIGPDHAFRLASVGKAFTAMTIMILAEEGKLSYEDDVKKHLPGFPYDGVTIRHLLNHTSGLPDYVALMDEHWDTEHAGSPDRTIATSRDALDKFIEHRPPILFPPGERYQYSNTGYIMLGLVAERASGIDFDIFLKERIFEPLGMSRTLLYSPIEDQAIGPRVWGYEITADGSEAVSTDHHYINGMHGDGETYSTLADMVKWDRALYTEKLVSRKTIEEAFSPALLKDGSTSDYGFGWGISYDEEGRKIVSHGGGWVGFRTQIVREIQTRDFTLILSTGSHARFWNIRKAVDDIVHGREYQIPGTPVPWIVGEAMRRGGIDAAVERYRDLRAARPDPDGEDYYEYRLYSLGRQYLENDEFDKAIAVLKLDVESYPEMSRVHNALGNAYVKAGKPEPAVRCFEKSLSLDPGEGNEAPRWLEEIKR
jgi:CubicO group peptidase (beta-lactamase class C family)